MLSGLAGANDPRRGAPLLATALETERKFLHVGFVHCTRPPIVIAIAPQSGHWPAGAPSCCDCFPNNLSNRPIALLHRAFRGTVDVTRLRFSDSLFHNPRVQAATLSHGHLRLLLPGFEKRLWPKPTAWQPSP